MAENFGKEYYIGFSQIQAGVPLLSDDSNSDIDLDLKTNEPYSIKLIEFAFKEPYPKNPLMLDVLCKSGGNFVISKKLYDILSPLKIDGVQMIVSTIYDPNNKKKYDDYYYVHIYNIINCLDMEKAKYERSVIGTIRTINKMVLDENILSKIPLEKRLIFRLGEIFTFQLFHESVVEKLNIQQGIRFVKVENYTFGSIMG